LYKGLIIKNIRNFHINIIKVNNPFYLEIFFTTEITEPTETSSNFSL
ncbi:MAG: hypothetical protein K1000chlam3_00579, partial [Chlamydiae bacterium]|nr:hypothetical protein [Chlamydiota bacterium]